MGFRWRVFQEIKGSSKRSREVRCIEEKVWEIGHLEGRLFVQILDLLSTEGRKPTKKTVIKRKRF